MYFVLSKHKTVCSATFLFVFKRIVFPWICKNRNLQKPSYLKKKKNKNLCTYAVHINERLMTKLSGSDS